MSVTNCLFPLGRAGWLIGSQEKLYSHQQNKQQKDPGSGPGVPALPEMTTSPSSPSSWSPMDHLFMCWPP
ncbi:hypothetical protein ACLKA7_008119 [Drosophila subpalustris]